MSKIGIFYGSSNGTTQEIAGKIANKLGVEHQDIYDVSNAKSSDLDAYDILLLGSSTWGVGDLQDDWEGFIGTLSSADLKNKKVALFGCGDASSYPDSFCDALGKIYQSVKNKTKVIGFVSTEGYSFDSSEAVVDNRFVGLVIDEDNESHLTDERINQWVKQLKEEF
ncbi:MAG: flavodoxin [Bacteroidales bacterium]|jgi:flavodoxin I|nr:flavodoxin [Bacteroidales bacterium]